MMEHGRQTAQQLTPEERRLAAMSIWNHEKGFAAAVIVLTWTFKVCTSYMTPCLSSEFLSRYTLL
jgi:hypothetical protein